MCIVATFVQFLTSNKREDIVPIYHSMTSCIVETVLLMKQVSQKQVSGHNMYLVISYLRTPHVLYCKGFCFCQLDIY